MLTTDTYHINNKYQLTKVECVTEHYLVHVNSFFLISSLIKYQIQYFIYDRAYRCLIVYISITKVKHFNIMKLLPSYNLRLCFNDHNTQQ